MAEQFRHDDIETIRSDVGRVAADTFDRLAELLTDDPRLDDNVTLFNTAAASALVCALDELCAASGLDTEAAFEQLLDAKRSGTFHARSRAH